VADLEYRNASVLLFDPVGPNLAATRSMLVQFGFERADATRDFSSLARKLSDGSYDLGLFEVSDAGGDVCSLVRRLRSGELGYNPFMVVILTSWARGSGNVSQFIDTGADDLLLRPFSPNTLQGRINAFARRRKPFVVTGSYIGPDRRHDSARPSNAQLIEAPNTLKAAAEGEREALLRHQDAVASAADTIDRERLRRLALRISAGAYIRLSGEADADEGGFEDLAEAASELRRRLTKREKSDAVEIADALCGVLDRIREEGSAAQEQLELLRELPLGVLAALDGEGAADRAREEIQAVLVKIRARYAKAPIAAAG
jgi:DNA-binding response OmpR family regulator